MQGAVGEASGSELESHFLFLGLFLLAFYGLSHVRFGFRFVVRGAFSPRCRFIHARFGFIHLFWTRVVSRVFGEGKGGAGFRRHSCGHAKNIMIV